jgi:thiol-disulfide isomerase/thioredoxin
MFRIRLLPIVCTLFLIVACSQTEQLPPKLTATVVDQNGSVLPDFSLHFIDAADNWTGLPYDEWINNGKDSISVSLPEKEPIVVKLSAPGYHPLYIFILPTEQSLDLRVKLPSPKKIPIGVPKIVGDFNNFSSQTGIEMTQQQNGRWTAEIESSSDTLNYAINHFIFGGNITGTAGELQFQDESRGVQPTFRRAVTKSTDQTSFTIEFDPAEYKNLTNPAEPEVQFISEVPENIEGVTKIYSLMIHEYLSTIIERNLAQVQGNEIKEHDYTGFLNELDLIKDRYSHPDVRFASDIAKLRLLDSDNFTASEIDSFLNRISSDSPLWLMHYTALSSAIDISGVENHISLLLDIANESPYPKLQGEALYNLVKYHHEKGNEEKLHNAFFELTSNHPDHFRAGYAYRNFAPEPPITEGQPLPYDEFKNLDGNGSLNLEEIDESYLLIDFWATWCGPCIQAMPKLQKLHTEFKDKDFAIVSISVDEETESVFSFQEKWKMPWYNAHEPQQSDKIRKMGIMGVPHYILLGPDRKVLSHDQSLLRSNKVSEVVSKYLNR